MNNEIEKTTFINRILKKGEASLIDFWVKTQNEARETKEAKDIFVKYIEGKKVTAIESKVMKNQFFDLLKVVFIGIPFALIPGSSVLMIVFVKVARKYKINVLPSSFDIKDKESK